MPLPMSGILVLIASPGDTAEERATVTDELVDWNVNRGRREGVALLPSRYEKHSIARMGGRAQQVINEQAVDKSDVVVAFFDARLGTATGVDVSGTAEEINRAIEAGKPVHVYFSDEPLPRDFDADQFDALKKFKSDLESRGLLGSYSDPQDLAGQVLRAVESDIEERGWSAEGTAVSTRSGGADLRWSHHHEEKPKSANKQGKMQYQTTRNDLTVFNDSPVKAVQLSFTVEGIGGTQFIFPDEPDGPVDIGGHSERSWILVPTPSMGSRGRDVLIKAEWTEDGDPKSGEWTVTLGR